MLCRVMRAGLIRGHAPALLAEEGVVEEERGYAYGERVEVVKDVMRVKGAVVVAYSGMVPAYDEVRAAVVLPYEGVEYRLLGAGVPHEIGRASCRERV